MQKNSFAHFHAAALTVNLGNRNVGNEYGKLAVMDIKAVKNSKKKKRELR